MKWMLTALSVAAVMALPSSDRILTGYTFSCPGGDTAACVKTGDIKFRVRELTVAEALSMLNDE